MGIFHQDLKILDSISVMKTAGAGGYLVRWGDPRPHDIDNNGEEDGVHMIGELGSWKVHRRRGCEVCYLYITYAPSNFRAMRLLY